MMFTITSIMTDTMSRIKRIVQLANQAYKDLGVGHSEYIYQRALEVNLRLNKIMYQTEVPLPILYTDYEDECIPIELKALVSEPRSSEINQLRNYLINENGLHKKQINTGLLINFPQPNKSNIVRTDNIEVIMVNQMEKSKIIDVIQYEHLGYI